MAIRIPKSEFEQRLANLRAEMAARGIDAMFVYGDEYRKENLRYVSNYWPIFERGGMLCALTGDPIVLCAPEGEKLAREMTAWPDVRLLPDFLCVTVPDEIDYPLATYTSFKKLAGELAGVKRLGISGMEDMSESLLNRIRAVIQGKNKEINCETQYDYRPSRVSYDSIGYGKYDFKQKLKRIYE